MVIYAAEAPGPSYPADAKASLPIGVFSHRNDPTTTRFTSKPNRGVDVPQPERHTLYSNGDVVDLVQQ